MQIFKYISDLEAGIHTRNQTLQTELVQPSKRKLPLKLLLFRNKAATPTINCDLVHKILISTHIQEHPYRRVCMLLLGFVWFVSFYLRNK